LGLAWHLTFLGLTTLAEGTPGANVPQAEAQRSVKPMLYEVEQLFIQNYLFSEKVKKS
jgi:hypothetical protein